VKKRIVFYKLLIYEHFWGFSASFCPLPQPEGCKIQVWVFLEQFCSLFFIFLGHIPLPLPPSWKLLSG